MGPRRPEACDRCLARPWLLSRLTSHLDRVRSRIQELLALDDAQLLAAVTRRNGAAIAQELSEFDSADLRERAERAGLAMICRCDPAYPARLESLPNAPSVLFVAGDVFRLISLCEHEPVAVIGSRRASGYGLEVSRSLGRGLGRAGVPVLSGMALGADAAAHNGALSVDAPTIAVLPGSAERPYPAGKRTLHSAIVSCGAAVSEAAPGSPVRRWNFPARNRIIAALAAMTVVVEASERSGALLTARLANELGRSVGAVPGRVDSPLAAGPNELLASGATVVRGPQDVLDELYGRGASSVELEERTPISGRLSDLYEALASGSDTPLALAEAGVPPPEGLAALSELELAGYVRRAGGGRYVVVP
jgi:DNA processing protein